LRYETDIACFSVIQKFPYAYESPKKRIVEKLIHFIILFRYLIEQLNRFIGGCGHANYLTLYYIHHKIKPFGAQKGPYWDQNHPLNEV
jgi:hypothetical protein